MATDRHREELLLVVLANAGMALDAESLAATYDRPIDEWRDSFGRLERRGLVEPVGDDLYALTADGENEIAVRGSGDGSAAVGVRITQ